MKTIKKHKLECAKKIIIIIDTCQKREYYKIKIIVIKIDEGGNMKIKAILLDFDGTSLQKDQVYISIKNMHALRKAMEKGVYIIPSTGRVENMQPPQIEANTGIRYWITSGGSRVVDRATGEIIYQCTWTPEESAELCKIFEGQKIYSEIAAEGKIFMEKEIVEHLEEYEVPPHHVWYLSLGRYMGVETPSKYFVDNKIGVEKLNIYEIPEDKQELIYNQLLDTGLVNITSPLGKNLQCFPKRLDRNNAIRALLKRLDISMDEVMCIGDSDLDLGGIMESGIGVAMGNASEHIKAAADYVTLPYDQDGVAVAIEKFVL